MKLHSHGKSQSDRHKNSSTCSFRLCAGQSDREDVEMTGDPRNYWIFITLLVFSWLTAYRAKLPTLHKIALGYFSTLALWALCPLNPMSWTEHPQIIEMALKSSMIAWALFMVVPYLVIRECSHCIIKYLAIFFVLDMAFIIWNPIPERHNFGLINGSTHDIALAMLLTPLVGNYIFTAIIFGVALYFSAKTAIIIGLIGLLFHLYQKNKIAFWSVLTSSLTVGGYYFSLNPGYYIRASKRLYTWIHHFSWWIESKMPVLGVGSFEAVGPHIYSKNPVYILHNDPLQILFETGISGFILFMVLCFYTLYLLRNNRAFLPIAVMYFVLMWVYFPLHSVPGQLIGALIIKESLYEKD